VKPVLVVVVAVVGKSYTEVGVVPGSYCTEQLEAVVGTVVEESCINCSVVETLKGSSKVVVEQFDIVQIVVEDCIEVEVGYIDFVEGCIDFVESYIGSEEDYIEVVAEVAELEEVEVQQVNDLLQL
jgi:hypothetical protein